MEHQLYKKYLRYFSVAFPTLIVRTLALLCSTVLFGFNPGHSFSQDASVLIEQDASLSVKEVLKLVHKKTDYYFIFKNDVLMGSQDVFLKKGTIETSDLLAQALEPNGLAYEFTSDKTIRVKKKPTSPPSIKTISDDLAQQIQVSGLILDETGQPLSGANVIEVGTTNGTQSDFNGAFSISVENLEAILSVSYIGFLTVEVLLSYESDVSNIRINMVQDTSIEEVVVVGYGTQSRENITGAVSFVQGETLGNRPITNAGAGLQGWIPNLNISSVDGQTGTGSNFNVRGFTNISGSGSPLILVDGVRMGVNAINPTDIQSVTVLKDAASAAVYGSQASFGVILITTKRGRKNEKIQMNFTSNWSLNTPSQKPDLVTSVQKLDFEREKASHLGATVNEENAALIRAHYDDPINNPAARLNPNGNGQWQYFGNTDYFDAAFEDFALQSKNDLSVRGGGDRIDYFFSFGQFSQEGVLTYGNDYYDRYNIRANLTAYINDIFDIRLNSALNIIESDRLHIYPGKGSPWHDLVKGNINQPLRNPDGTVPNNPISFFEQGGRDKFNRTDSWVTLGTNFRPLEGLEVDASYTYNSDNDRWHDHTKEVTRWWGPEIFRSNNSVPTAIAYRFRNIKYQAFNGYISYTTHFGEHYLKGQVGYQQEDHNVRVVNTRNNNLVTDLLPSLSLSSGDPRASDGINGWATRGGFYRVNYSFKDRYLLELSGRYDGSSRFPKGNRFVFNPSASAGWKISEEPFFASLKSTINSLKLRASYGSLGNQQVQGFYPYLSNLSLGTSGFVIGGGLPRRTNTPGLVSSSITWETVVTQNIGLDGSLWGSKLVWYFDYFIRDAKDQLQAAAQLPAVLGTSAPRVNSADTRTKGWEFEIQYRNSDRAFKYTAGVNLSRAKGEITSFDNPTNSIGNVLGRRGYPNLYKGMDVGEIWGYATKGLFQNQEEIDASGLNYSNLINSGVTVAPGDVYYVDQNGDGIISGGSFTLEDPGDLVKIGSSTPDLSFGINLGAVWKNFFADAFMQGVLGRQMFFAQPTGNGPLYWPSHGGGNNSLNSAPMVHQLDYWTPDNTDAFWPRYLGNRGFHNYRLSDRYLPNTSYFRMKQLTFGYNFPSKLASTIGLQEAQVYFTGQNLFEIDDLIEGYDPETNPRGAPWGEPGKSYPFLRSFSIGLNIKL